MGRAAGLDRNHGRSKPLEKRHHVLAPQLPAKNRALGGVHPMKLKNVLRRIHANSANMFHGRSPFLRSTTTSFWHIDAVGGRPPQQASFIPLAWTQTAAPTLWRAAVSSAPRRRRARPALPTQSAARRVWPSAAVT